MSSPREAVVDRMAAGLRLIAGILEEIEAYHGSRRWRRGAGWAGTVLSMWLILQHEDGKRP